MRALIITTLRGADSPELQLIIGILAEHELAVATSGSLGAGARLARGLTPDIGAAIAILPKGGARSSGWSAVMVEVGVCLGADIPVLAVLHPDDKLPPAVSTVQHVRADLSDADTLRLHLGMFVRAARHQDRQPGAVTPWFDLERHASRAPGTSGGAATQDGLKFEWRVADLLRGPTSVLARGERDRMFGPDAGVDFAFSIGDPEDPIVVVVEVKRSGRRASIRQLMSYVETTGADVGLLVTEEAMQGVSAEDHPEIIVLSFLQLQEVVGAGRLESVLRTARNRAVHGA